MLEIYLLSPSALATSKSILYLKTGAVNDVEFTNDRHLIRRARDCRCRRTTRDAKFARAWIPGPWAARGARLGSPAESALTWPDLRNFVPYPYLPPPVLPALHPSSRDAPFPAVDSPLVPLGKTHPPRVPTQHGTWSDVPTGSSFPRPSSFCLFCNLRVLTYYDAAGAILKYPLYRLYLAVIRATTNLSFEYLDGWIS